MGVSDRADLLRCQRREKGGCRVAVITGNCTICCCMMVIVSGLMMSTTVRLCGWMNFSGSFMPREVRYFAYFPWFK